MWIFLNNAMLSVVVPRARSAAAKKDYLIVRARCRGDIERVFPQAHVVENPFRDYVFRAMLPRAEVANAVAQSVMEIDYQNFKDSVSENDRHDAYLECWDAMNALQVHRGHGGMYSKLYRFKGAQHARKRP